MIVLTWDEIFKYLKSEGFEKSSIDHFFCFIGKPDEPRDFHIIVKNILNVFLTYEAYPWLYEEINIGIHKDIYKWKLLCKSLSNLYVSRGISINDRNYLNPYYNNIGKNRLHYMLWEPPEPYCDFIGYYQVFTYIFISIITIKNLRSIFKILDFPDYYFDNIEYDGLFYISLFTIIYKNIDKNLIFNSEIELNDFIKNLGLGYYKLTEPARYIKEGLLKNNKYRTIPPFAKIASETASIKARIEEESPALEYKVFQRPRLTQKVQDERELSGVSPAEDVSSLEYVTTEDKTETKKTVKSIGQKALMSTSAKKHLAMDNQLYKYRWELLDSSEVNILLRAIQDISTNGQNSKYYPGGIDPLECITFICLMFWAGKAPECLSEFIFYRNENEIENIFPRPGVLFNSSSHLFLVAVPATPARKIYPDEEQKKHTLPIKNSFLLSMPITVEQIIKRYIQNRPNCSNPKFFATPSESYIVAIKKFIKVLNDIHFARFTSERISSFIFSKIMEAPGADIVTAMFLTGNDHFLGRNQSYYTCIPVSRLQTIYESVCNDLAGETSPQQRKRNSKYVEFYIGSPFTPTKSSVQTLVKSFLNGFSRASLKKNSSVPLVHYHMLRYTAFLVLFATGYRAIHEPIPLITEIDEQTGFAVISDKDSEDRFKSRLVWLPPVCAAQLKLFWEHAYQIFPKIMDSDPKAIDIQTKTDRHFSIHALQFLGKSGKIFPLSPEILSKSVENTFPLPINSGRHYLRSNLLAQGCPPEVIDAYLGHWERGEEPWGRFSGMSPNEFTEILAQFLVPLLAEDGWIPFGGSFA